MATSLSQSLPGRILQGVQEDTLPKVGKSQGSLKIEQLVREQCSYCVWGFNCGYQAQLLLAVRRGQRRHQGTT